MQEGIPDWMKQQYLSEKNAQLGTNAGSPIGADSLSRGLLQQNEDWKRYYQNLGLSVAGMQPLTQGSAPTTSNYTSTFTPSSILSYNSSNYSPYASAYTSMYNTNAQLSQSNPWLSAGAGILGSTLGGWASTRRYKKNIKLWVKH
jgi:hypothetical protein